MTAPAATVDLLDQVIERLRPRLMTGTTKERVRALWAAALTARNLGAADVVHDRFMALAREIGLLDRRGYWLAYDVRKSVRRYGAEDVAHVITWALRNKDPFEGPRQ